MKTTIPSIRSSLFILGGILLGLNALPALGAGRAAFPVMSALMEPQLMALGGAAATVTGSPLLAEVNPAAAAGGGSLASAGFARHSIGMWSGRLSFNRVVLGTMVGRVAVSNFDFGALDYSERGTGRTGASFQARETQVSIGVADYISNSISWGAALDVVNGSVAEENASGMAFDCGVIWDPSWEKVRLGLAAVNIGSQFDGYGADRDPMPGGVIFGISKRLEHLPLQLHLLNRFQREGEGDFAPEWLPGNSSVSLAAGGEFTVIPSGMKHPLFLRFGYQSRGEGQRTGQQLDALAGFSFGFGFQAGPVRFDYAIAPQGGLGEVQRIGISGEF